MAANIKKEKIKEKSSPKISQLWGFSNLNYFYFAFALILIICGYLVMATGEVNSFQSLTIAPIFLFIGYIILIPISLIIKRKEK